MSFRAGAATDTGRVRSNNQDSNLIATNLYAVADGMGGHQGGEVASAIAVDTLRDAVNEPTAVALIEGVKLANQAIFERQAGTPELRGMGTTLCAVALVEDDDGTEEILVVNVGDSRVYRFHDDELVQVTRDHSLVEDLRREGRLTDAEAAVHPHRNVLTRALGIDANVAVDDFHLEPQAGDRFLLCSDGLFNEVTEDRIAATLRRLADPGDAAGELVRQANENGGRDNITCLIVDVVATSAGAAAAGADGVSGKGRRRTKPLDARAGADPAPPAPPPTPTEDDLAGFTQPIPAVPASATGGGEGADGDVRTAKAGAVAADEPLTRIRRKRRFTWRVLLFIVLFVVIVGAAAVLVVWQGRGTYYVAFDGHELTIYQGVPGGLLGIDPTVYKRCPGLTTATVANPMLTEIQNRKRFEDFPDARNHALTYLKNVENLSGAQCNPPRAATPPASPFGQPGATTVPPQAGTGTTATAPSGAPAPPP